MKYFVHIGAGTFLLALALGPAPTIALSIIVEVGTYRVPDFVNHHRERMTRINVLVDGTEKVLEKV
jgi:hypothetical protein